MKLYLTILLFMSSMLIFSADASTDNSPTYIVSVSEDNVPEYVYDPPVPRRSASKKILCAISPAGVSIPGVTSDEILSYDIYDTKGGCIASFATEADFISFIYNYKGTIEIRLYTETSVYHGFLTI